MFTYIRKLHLKVKIKSLAEEARIIKKEIKKARVEAKNSLRNHHTDVVRHECRHSLLAYGVIKSTPYKAMENKCHTLPDFEKVDKLAKRFGATEEQRIAWLTNAKEYIKSNQL